MIACFARAMKKKLGMDAVSAFVVKNLDIEVSYVEFLANKSERRTNRSECAVQFGGIADTAWGIAIGDGGRIERGGDFARELRGDGVAKRGYDRDSANSWGRVNTCAGE